eukprot:365461-Chlamydomonas_euryale.AAC.5
MHIPSTQQPPTTHIAGPPQYTPRRLHAAAGLDYTVAHYGILTKDPRLDVVLCFVDNRLSNADAERQHETGGGAGGGDTIGDAGAPSGPPPRKGVGLGAPGRAAASSSSSAPGRPVLDGAKVAAWDCGEVGGFEAYLLAEDDKDGEGPEDTYRCGGAPTGVGGQQQVTAHIPLKASPHTHSHSQSKHTSSESLDPAHIHTHKAHTL